MSAPDPRARRRTPAPLVGRAAAILAGAALAFASASPRLHAQNNRYGVVTSIFDDALQGVKTTELGAGIVRLNFYWYLMEPAPGEFDFASTDSDVATAIARGLDVYASLSFSPPWAAPALNAMPANIGDWQAFVAAVIDRYRAYGTHVTFGVWNEPNLDEFLQGGSATDYARLFQSADAARQTVNPSARLGAPETSQHALGNGYLASVLPLIAPYQRAQDVATVHWYYGGVPPDLGSYMTQILSAVNGRETWLTETGYASCDDGVQEAHTSALVDVFNAFLQPLRPIWTKFFMYVLANGDNCSETLVRADGSDRPSFTGYQARIPVFHQITLQSLDGEFVSAASATGPVRADRSSAGDSETFFVWDVNGGSLESGDPVQILTPTRFAFRPESGRFAELFADGFGASPDQLLHIVGLDAPSIVDGSHVAFETTYKQFLTAEGGGGGNVNANAAVIGAFESFRINIR